MTPSPLATMHSAATRVVVKTPFTFRSMTLSNVSSVYSINGVLSEIPALFTRISTHPYFPVTSLKAFLTDSRLARSGLIPSTIASGYFSFSFVTARSAEPCVLAVKITAAPSFKNLSAVAKPMPRLPPVMIATLSFNLIQNTSLLCLVIPLFMILL